MDTQNRKPKKKPPKIEDMTKEQIRKAVLKKRECNAKAQTIVENLLEKHVTEEFFMKCLPDINQSHFEDIIEERSIGHLCGYPLCPKILSVKDIPKQKYRISLKTNKVYDITARKNFCSNGCYKSAMHVKKQMLTSPLWFREYEEVPNINLLPVDSIGSLGQEVDLNLIEKIEINQDKYIYTSINDFTKASLNEITENESSQNSVGQNSENDQNDNMNISIDSDNCVSPVQSRTVAQERSESDENQDEKIKPVVINHQNVSEKSKPSLESSVNKDSKKPIPNPLNIVGEVIERPERNLDPILCDVPTSSSINSANESKEKAEVAKKKLLQKKQPSIAAITIEVEKCLAEWFTLDTLLFLFGEEKVKEMVTDKGECIKEYLNNYAKSVFYTSNTYDQYQALCRKLNMLELEDRKYDYQTLQRETKPLPDYSIIKEESKKIQLKVKAFFSGETEIPETQPEAAETVSEDNENTTQLPLVDKNAQNALRRRIVCQHLNKVLPDILRSLSLATVSVNADIRLLVNTFKLKANNIMFKPIQWTLIALIFIKLLSIRDMRLEYLLEQPTCFKHMQLLLLSYKQDGGYLDRLISWLTDIDRMLDTDDTQLTIE